MPRPSNVRPSIPYVYKRPRLTAAVRAIHDTLGEEIFQDLVMKKANDRLDPHLTEMDVLVALSERIYGLHIEPRLGREDIDSVVARFDEHAAYFTHAHVPLFIRLWKGLWCTAYFGLPDRLQGEVWAP